MRLSARQALDHRRRFRPRLLPAHRLLDRDLEHVGRLEQRIHDPRCDRALAAAHGIEHGLQLVASAPRRPRSPSSRSSPSSCGRRERSRSAARQRSGRARAPAASVDRREVLAALGGRGRRSGRDPWGLRRVRGQGQGQGAEGAASRRSSMSATAKLRRPGPGPWPWPSSRELAAPPPARGSAGTA